MIIYKLCFYKILKLPYESRLSKNLAEWHKYETFLFLFVFSKIYKILNVINSIVNIILWKIYFKQYICE